MSFVVEREKEIQEWNEQQLPKVLPGYSGGRLPGRSTKVKGREEGEEDEDSGVRRIRKEIAHEVVTGIKEKTSGHEEVKTTAPKTAGQSLMRSWDCSQIEKRRRGGRGSLAKRKPEASLWNGGVYGKAGSTEYENGEKTAG